MTRKDYVALAKAFSDTYPTPSDFIKWQYETWNKTLIAVANVLETDNPRFDRERFYQAAIK